MEFIMNINFSNNSNNNADGCFKLYKYTESKFVFLFAEIWKITPWSLVLHFAFQLRCSNFAWVLILSLRSFLEDFVFSTTDLTDVPQYVTCMWEGMIKLPTTIESVLFVTLVWLKTNFIFSCIVQSIQSQGKNSIIKSNTILSILIRCLPQNY